MSVPTDPSTAAGVTHPTEVRAGALTLDVSPAAGVTHPTEVRAGARTLDVSPADGMIRLCGDLDLRSADRLEEVGRSLADAGVRHIVIDCGHLRFCDSTGLRSFVAIRSAERVESVTLARRSSLLQRMLEATALDVCFGRTPPLHRPRRSRRLAGAAGRAPSA
jgi:anti-sigma B factor antagonist